MARFLLVHGSCHGSWCWRDLTPELQARGHEVHALDLPGSPGHPMPHAEVTLDICSRTVADALEALAGPAVVVGHSWGGYPITGAAALAPDRIARLIYLCAYLPMDGLSLMEMRQLSPFQSLASYLEISDDGASFFVPTQHQRGLFYQDCTAEAQEYAAARLGPQALRPQQETFDDTEAARALPRSYISCREDGTIHPDLQDVMSEDLPEADRHALPTGHSPFFADPEGLAVLLDRIAGQKVQDARHAV